MEIDEREVGEVLVVKPLEKRIDASVSPDLKGRMIDWINDGRKQIVLDLSSVDFIDSSGLGTLVSILKTIGNRGELCISSLRETVMSLFRLTRMDKVFRVYPTAEDAVAAFSEVDPTEGRE